jgi:membrane protease YdiL (CAAX protease family)
MSARAAASSAIWAALWGTGSEHVPALAGVLAVGILLPLLIVLPVYWRGRARRRLGKPPGWSGPGWTLGHVWLAFAFLLAAEIVVFYVLQPDVFERLVSGRALSPIEIPPAMPALGQQLLWTTVAVSSCLLIVIPLAPRRLLWTTRWTATQCLTAAIIGWIALRLLARVIAPAVPELTSSEHPQHELTRSVTQLGAQHSAWLMLVVVAGLAPLVEEVLFRGVLLTGLARQISFGWANAIQAVLFATLHLTPPLFPFFLVMGLMSGLLVRYSGGLLASFALHALNNGTAVAALYWAGSGGPGG